MNKTTKELSHPAQFPHIVYKHRILGMALGGLANATVLYELNASLPYWIWLILACIIWPHIAFFKAIKSTNPYYSERNNLLIDSFIAGTWASMLHFNMLPAVLLLVITFSDKISSGIKNLWLYSLPIMLLGIVIAGLFTGFSFQPNTSKIVILSTLPILIIHTFLVSYGSHLLIRKVQSQNIKFKLLSQEDPLTGLYNRKYWQELANEIYTKCNDTSLIATLVLIDIDKFKQINDQFGHLVGDDVLNEIAKIITTFTDDDAIYGRLGGDEFALVIPEGVNQTLAIAETICQKVSECKLDSTPDLQCTISIGLAQTSMKLTSFRSWFEEADKNLYKAKHAGKNQVNCC